MTPREFWSAYGAPTIVDYTVGPGQNVLIPPDPSRYALWILTAANPITVTPFSSNLFAAGGMQIVSPMIFILNHQQHGSIVSMGFRLTSGILLTSSYLTASIRDRSVTDDVANGVSRKKRGRGTARLKGGRGGSRVDRVPLTVSSLAVLPDSVRARLRDDDTGFRYGRTIDEIIAMGTMFPQRTVPVDRRRNVPPPSQTQINAALLAGKPIQYDARRASYYIEV